MDPDIINCSDLLCTMKTLFFSYSDDSGCLETFMEEKLLMVVSKYTCSFVCTCTAYLYNIHQQSIRKSRPRLGAKYKYNI